MNDQLCQMLIEVHKSDKKLIDTQFEIIEKFKDRILELEKLQENARR